MVQAGDQQVESAHFLLGGAHLCPQPAAVRTPIEDRATFSDPVDQVSPFDDEFGAEIRGLPCVGFLLGQRHGRTVTPPMGARHSIMKRFRSRQSTAQERERLEIGHRLRGALR